MKRLIPALIVTGLILTACSGGKAATPIVEPTQTVTQTGHLVPEPAVTTPATGAPPLQALAHAPDQSSGARPVVEGEDPYQVSFSCTDAMATERRTFLSLAESYEDFSVSYCTTILTGSKPSPSEEQAMKLAYPGGSKDYDQDLKVLYEKCVDRSDIRIAMDSARARILEGAAALCPDHRAVAAFYDAAEKGYGLDGTTTKKFIFNASHLVGSEALPGVWETYRSKVSQCYWEISDAAGNIIDNSLITVAPRFTVTVPVDAAGFTAKGCSFRWVSE